MTTISLENVSLRNPSPHLRLGEVLLNMRFVNATKTLAKKKKRKENSNTSKELGWGFEETFSVAATCLFMHPSTGGSHH